MDYRKYISEKLKAGGIADAISEAEIYEALALPPTSEMGDYALPCFRFAKVFRKSPALIAEELKGKISPDEVISEISAVNGYLNFKVNKNRLAEEVTGKILGEKDAYGASDEGKG